MKGSHLVISQGGTNEVVLISNELACAVLGIQVPHSTCAEREIAFASLGFGINKLGDDIPG
jgi:hypothetical protein